MFAKFDSLFAPRYPKGYVGRHRARYLIAFPLTASHRSHARKAPA